MPGESVAHSTKGWGRCGLNHAASLCSAGFLPCEREGLPSPSGHKGLLQSQDVVPSFP